MALMVGTGPFGRTPGGVFDVEVNAPEHQLYLERSPRGPREHRHPAGRTAPRPGGRGPFLDELASHDQAGAIADLDRPLLITQAVDDEIVAAAEGERIFAAAHRPKAFYPLQHADHLLTDRRAAEHALQIARDWFGATL